MGDARSTLSYLIGSEVPSTLSSAGYKRFPLQIPMGTQPVEAFGSKVRPSPRLSDLYAKMQSSPMNRWVGIGPVEAVGQANLATVFECMDLPRYSRVLDLGCGIGRTAAPIAEYLTDREVVGADIVAEMIRFCNENVKPVFRNTNFFVISNSNPLYDHYNENKSLAQEDISIFSPDKFEEVYESYFDTVFAFSVFTHFTPEMASKTFRMISRITTEDAVVLITAFIDVPWGKYRLRTGDEGFRDCQLLKLNFALFDANQLIALASEAGFRLTRLIFGTRDADIPLVSAAVLMVTMF